MQKEKLATIGLTDGGGRGTALADGYLRSSYVGTILAFPGNDMMKLLPSQRGYDNKTVETFPDIKTTDVDKIVEICRERGVALVDVCQENAIQLGLVNKLQEERISAVGPTREAGMIESSKGFSRLFGNKHKLPQPWFAIFGSEDFGRWCIENHPFEPKFIKADGLCEGKGAIAAETEDEAINAIKQMARFKEGAGKTYLIEEFLRGDDGSKGEEFSAFAISDGKTVKIIGYAQDHKRLGTFDVGPNTGGMGCSTPPLVLYGSKRASVQEEITGIFNKTIDGLADGGTPYKGILYLGGMLVKRGTALKPYVIEWNSRWGDPEAEVLVPGIRNDLFDMGISVANGNIVNLKIETDGKARVSIAGVSRGYPGNYDAVKGKRIFGLEDAMKVEGVTVYGAGVMIVEGKYYASGGRLFHIVGEGENAIEARSKALEAMAKVQVEGNNLDYRIDIGHNDVDRLLLRR